VLRVLVVVFSAHGDAACADDTVLFLFLLVAGIARAQRAFLGKVLSGAVPERTIAVAVCPGAVPGRKSEGGPPPVVVAARRGLPSPTLMATPVFLPGLITTCPKLGTDRERPVSHPPYDTPCCQVAW